eukprot:15467002-Alexandrium_andersonii.AAC.2
MARVLSAGALKGAAAVLAAPAPEVAVAGVAEEAGAAAVGVRGGSKDGAAVRRGGVGGISAGVAAGVAAGAPVARPSSEASTP